MDRNQQIVRTVDLGYDQLLMLHGQPGTRVRVLFGGVWLTEEGVLEDKFAGSGEEVALQARSRALLEGLGPTRVEVIEPARASLARVQAAWSSLRRTFAALPLPRIALPRALAARAVALAIAIGVGMGVPELIAKQFAIEQSQQLVNRPTPSVLGATPSTPAQCDVSSSANSTLRGLASAGAAFLPMN